MRIGLLLLNLLVNGCVLNWPIGVGPDLDVTLHTMKEKYTYMEELSLVVEVVNREDRRIKIVKSCDVNHMQDNYCKIVIEGVGRLVSISEEISDAGDIEENDYVVLPPGATLKMRVAPLGIAYKDLVPGRYRAHVEYWVDFEEDVRLRITPPRIYHSPEVYFDVVKPAR